jgi:translation initiation factor 5
MCNIPSHIDDPSYRYKMPKLTTRIEGRGNGIKTNMVNMNDVARALKTNPAYITKFMGAELGALSSYSFEEEKSIVNGAHETGTGQTMIDKFIDKFILCPNCKLPEIDMLVKKGFLCAGCKACGWSGDLDNNHKLVKFILQNPPGGDAGGGGGGKKNKGDRREKQREKAKKKKGSDDEDSDSEEEAKAKKEKKEKKEKKKEKKEKKKKEKGDSDDDSDDEDAAKKEKKKEKKEKKDKKEKKEKKKEKKKDKKAKDDSDSDKDSDSDDGPKKASKDSKADDDDLVFTDEVIKESIARTKRLIQEAEGKGKPLGAEKFFDEVRMIQIQNSFSTKLRLYVALEGVFGDNMLPDKVKAKMPYWKKLVSTPPMSVAEILYAFEVYYVENPKNRKQYPMVLKEVYGADLLPEAELLRHYGKQLDSEGFEEAKGAAQPFLDWLQQEDSESSDDDDDEDGDDDVDVDDI